MSRADSSREDVRCPLARSPAGSLWVLALAAVAGCSCRAQTAARRAAPRSDGTIARPAAVASDAAPPLPHAAGSTAARPPTFTVAPAYRYRRDHRWWVDLTVRIANPAGVPAAFDVNSFELDQGVRSLYTQWAQNMKIPPDASRSIHLVFWEAGKEAPPRRVTFRAESGGRSLFARPIVTTEISERGVHVEIEPNGVTHVKHRLGPHRPASGIIDYWIVITNPTRTAVLFDHYDLGCRVGRARTRVRQESSFAGVDILRPGARVRGMMACGYDLHHPAPRRVDVLYHGKRIGRVSLRPRSPPLFR